MSFQTEILFLDGGPERKLCAGSLKIRQSGYLAAMRKRKGFLTRLLVPFDRRQKELPVWHKDIYWISSNFQ